MELRPLKPSSARRDVIEEQMARRRDRERHHSDVWGQQVRYYDRMDRQTAKYEQFTSPRYYETQSQKQTEAKKVQEKSEKLERRRDKLRRLFHEENASFNIEMMMHKAKRHVKSSKIDEVPLELLQKVSGSLRIEEEDRRRVRAENSLYRQWCDNSPVLRESHTNKNAKDVKLSWLDQQIEKRMAKEREEEETQNFLKQQELYLKEQREKDEQQEKESKEKREMYERALKEQMDRVVVRENDSQRLQEEEDRERKRRLDLADLESQWEQEERRRRDREIALANVREARRKLEVKAKNIHEEIDADREFVEKLRDAELCEQIRDRKKKDEIRNGMNEFLNTLKQLKELEESRKQHYLFTFDSEAGGVFKTFEKTWQQEQEMRRSLVKNFLDDLGEQIERNIERDREQRQRLIQEREDMLKGIEEQREEVARIEEWEEQRKLEYKKSLELQIKENKVRKKKLHELQKKSASDDLENIRKEEERLKKEIMNIQRGKPQQTYGRRRFFY